MTVVMVSGASAGVGRATVRRFAAPGVVIGLIARDGERLEQAAGEVRAAGGEALVLPADVSDADAVEDAATTLEDRFGAIDIWINNAMVTVLSPVLQMTADEYRRVTEVTYLGTVHGTQAALRRMARRNRGAIVQVASALGYRPAPLQSAYCAAKSAIIGFTDSLRAELLHDRSNVTVTAVQLPAVNTPQFDWARNKLPRRPQPVPPVFEPELIAEAIHHAAFHPRREYWLGFSTIKAILGQRIAPWLGDRMMASQGYSGQMTDQPARSRPDNLFDPVPGDLAARGRFSARAASRSPAIWSSEHRDSLVMAGAFAATGVAAALLIRAAGRPRGRRRLRS